MACSEVLAKRLTDAVGNGRGISEQKLFGGTAILVNGNMACGITKDDELMVRLDYAAAEKAARRKHARVCDFTGRPMRGLVLIEAAGFKDKRALASWIRPALDHAASLPPKATSKPKAKARAKKAPQAPGRAKR